MAMDNGGSLSSRKVTTVGTTCEIIRALVELDGGGVTKVANYLEKSKGSIHSHLVTLAEEGFVIKQDSTYHVSLQFLDIGNYARHQLDVYSAADTALTHAAEKTGEYVHLVVEQHGLGYHVMKKRGEKAVGTASRIGKAYPLTHTAPGKAILAFLPESRVDEILVLHGMPASTANSITNKKELLKEIESVRQRGFAFDNEEHIHGIRSIGAPIIDTDGSVAASISVSGPRERMENERYNEEIPNLVKQTANYIEIALSTQS